MMAGLTLALVILLLSTSVFGCWANPAPKTAQELQQILDNAEPGDVIELLPIEYQGDFVANKSGSYWSPITVTSQKERIEEKFGPFTFTRVKTATLIGNITAFTIHGNHWILDGLEINSGENGVIFNGNNNLLNSCTLQNTKQAVTINGSRNELKSTSIVDASNAIIIHGSDNIVRGSSIINVENGIFIYGTDNVIKGSTVMSDSTGVTFLSGKGNEIKGSTVSAILINKESCCGRVRGSTITENVEIFGDSFHILGNTMTSGVNVSGCSNNLLGNTGVSGSYHFNKKCGNRLLGNTFL